LTVSVEDEAGPRANGKEGSGGSLEQQMDLASFYHQFIRPGRGIATATAEAGNDAGERHLKELLDAILVDRHPAKETAGRHV
jgi:hypothetical protein